MAFFPTQDLVARPIENYVWDPMSMAWVKETQPSGGGGGGGTSSSFGAAFPATGTATGFKDSSGNMAGANLDVSGNLLVNVAVGGSTGAVTIADGADVAEGATTDIAVTTDANGTVSGKLRGLVKIFSSVWDSVNKRLKVDGSGVTQPVSGTVTTSPPANATTNISEWGGAGVSSATTLSDAIANPTSPLIGACLMSWNPLTSQWQRALNDQTGDAGINVAVQNTVSTVPTAPVGDGNGTMFSPGDQIATASSFADDAPLYIGELQFGTATQAVVAIIDGFIFDAFPDAASVFKSTTQILNLVTGVSTYGPIIMNAAQPYVKFAIQTAGPSNKTYSMFLVSSNGSVKGAWRTLDNGGATISSPLPAGPNIIGKVDASVATVSTRDLNLYPILSEICQELKVITFYLQAGLNVRDDPDAIRKDLYYSSTMSMN